MAQINKQEIMQKLIDELELFPAQDVIPNQLAEKIVPTFLVNSQEVEVQTPTANVVRQAQANNSTATIYTVPATGSFYLTNVSISQTIDKATASSVKDGYVEVTIDGTARKILYVNRNHTANDVPDTQQLSFNLQNPVLLDPSSTVTVTAELGTWCVACIVGYTTD